MGQNASSSPEMQKKGTTEVMGPGQGKPDNVTDSERTKAELMEFPLLRNMERCKTVKQDVEHKNGKVTFGSHVHIQDFGSDYWSKVEEENHYKKLSKQNAYVIIDVGGERFQANRDSFLKYPNTRLGRLMKSASIAEILTLCEEYIPGNPAEYFFDKNPENFSSVLEMYRTGDFHIPDGGQG